MIRIISIKISNYVSRYQELNNTEKEVYRYCFEQILSKILFYLCVIAFGIFSRHFTTCVLFLFTFVPLRSFGGGAHASTKARCTFLSYSISFIAISIGPVISNYIPESLLYALYVCSILYPLLKAPVDTKNKRFTKAMQQHLRLKFLLYVLLLTSVFSLMFILNLKSSYGMISICAMIFNISFVIGEWQNRKDS